MVKYNILQYSVHDGKSPHQYARSEMLGFLKLLFQIRFLNLA